jgi:uncharacterized protein HemX
MTLLLSLLLAALALLVGVGLGFGLRGWREESALLRRAEKAERLAQDEAVRGAARAAALEAKAHNELTQARAETEKLTKHLSQACDELDRLRLLAAAIAPGDGKGPETGPGFAATMPMQDL